MRRSPHARATRFVRRIEARQPTGLARTQVQQQNGESNDFGNDEGRGRRPLPGSLRLQGRSEASRARIEGLDGLSRSERRGPRVGAVRLGRAGLAELRVRSRRCRRSSRKPGTWASRKRPCSPARTGRRRRWLRQRSRPARVGIITDQTGPLSFMGIANTNVAKMVDRRHQRRGRPARPPDRVVHRGQRDRRRSGRSRGDQARRTGAGRRRPRRHLQLHSPGHQGPGGRAGQHAVHLSGAVRGAGVPPADLLHRSGAGAAGRTTLSLVDATHRGEDVLHAVGRLHLASHHEQEGP